MIDYLIHRNGRGRLYGDAEANRATYIDRSSSAHDSAKLRDCKVINCSRVNHSAQVYGGEFSRTRINGHTVIAGHPHVRDSIIDCSEISGLPTIDSVVITGNSEICDNPSLSGLHRPLHLHDAIIYGSPTIKGDFKVTGRVHEGIWTRAPKHIKLPWCDLSECIDGKVLLDCRCRTVDYWLRHGAKLARRWDWSEDMIAVTLATIKKEFYTDSEAAHQEMGAVLPSDINSTQQSSRC